MRITFLTLFVFSLQAQIASVRFFAVDPEGNDVPVEIADICSSAPSNHWCVTTGAPQGAQARIKGAEAEGLGWNGYVAKVRPRAGGSVVEVPFWSFGHPGQRVGLVIGRPPEAGDVAYATTVGRLSGCTGRDGLWVKAAPLFGQWEALPEAPLGPNGEFTLSGPTLAGPAVLFISNGTRLLGAISYVSRPGTADKVLTLDGSSLCAALPRASPRK